MKKYRLGIFKLKDTIKKNTVQLDIPLILKNMPGPRHIWITKLPKENNKFVIDVHYKELSKEERESLLDKIAMPKNEDKIQFEKN